jgi:predicted TIM-barrel fold metal-dependent hydrolase
MSKNWIDTHFHVFDAGISVSDARYVPQYCAPVATWRQQSQAAGVDQGVLVQPSFLGTNNAFLLQQLAAQPQWLRGIAVISPDTPLLQLQQLQRAGIRGIRLNLAGQSHEIPQWADSKPIWNHVRELAWHVEIHTDRGALAGVLNQLPADITLVIDHMGKPSAASKNDPSIAALVSRAKNSPVFVKLSAGYRVLPIEPKALARVLLNELGPKALLWGSDWPCTNHEQHANYAALVAEAGEWIDPRYLEQVMKVNPRLLYWGI